MQDVVHCRTHACFYQWKPWEFDITFYILCSFSRPWELVLEASSYPSLLAHIPTCLKLLNLWTVNSRVDQKHTPQCTDFKRRYDNIVSVVWDIRLWCDHLNRAFSVGYTKCLWSEAFLNWVPAWDWGLGFALPGVKTYENFFLGTLKLKKPVGYNREIEKRMWAFQKACLLWTVCFRLYPPNTLRNFL